MGDAVSTDPAETPAQAPETDAAPHPDEKPMGGNPENPDVNVLADVKDEGLAPAHSEDATVVSEAEAAAVSLQAQNALQLAENEIAILKRDNAGLRERDEATTSKMKELYNLLDAPDGENVEDRVKGMKAAAKAAEDRIAALQIALGIGPGEEPQAKVDVEEIGSVEDLGFFGSLLLLTALARVHPLLRSEYNNVPTQVRTPEGDLWAARLVEDLDEDEQPVRSIVVTHELGSYAHQEAVNRKTKLDGDLAVAIRGYRDAETRLGVNAKSQAPDIRKAVDDQMRDARKRVEEIQAELKAIEPKTLKPTPVETRFPADPDRYALKAGN